MPPRVAAELGHHTMFRILLPRQIPGICGFSQTLQPFAGKTFFAPGLHSPHPNRNLDSGRLDRAWTFGGAFTVYLFVSR